MITGAPIVSLGVLPGQYVVPRQMHAWVVERDRHGEPTRAMRQRVLDTPEIRSDEILVLIMAVGVNYNGLWIARGEPVSPFTWHSQDYHVPGSEAAGIVWRCGAGVKNWRVGDEVTIQCAMTCGQCDECNGGDLLACRRLKVYGYETPNGCFAQFAVVKPTMLVRKPPNLAWEEAATIGVASIAYRMLLTLGGMGPTDRVLVWGAAGGLGSMAVQLCRLVGADCVGVVSSEAKAAFCRSLGLEKLLLRTAYDCWDGREPDDPGEARRYHREMLRFDRDLRAWFDGRRPTIVLEHPGRETFPVSVFACDAFGAVVTCGATSGYHVTFDVRHLWMRHKRILGSHQTTLHETVAVNRFFESGRLRPLVTATYPFERLPQAHEQLLDPETTGKLAVLVQAPGPGVKTHR